MNHKLVTVDVRDDIRQGREPFSKIMQAVDGLGAGNGLKLIAPFEPAPLYSVLGKRGFTHRATEMPDGDWEIVFRLAPQAGVADKEPDHLSATGATSADLVEVDARGLEPPQPLVKILEALSSLPVGAGLRARTDRRPMHLYAHLEERGYTGHSEEQADGSFVTIVSPR